MNALYKIRFTLLFLRHKKIAPLTGVIFLSKRRDENPKRFANLRYA